MKTAVPKGGEVGTLELGAKDVLVLGHGRAERGARGQKHFRRPWNETEAASVSYKEGSRRGQSEFWLRAQEQHSKRSFFLLLLAFPDAAGPSHRKQDAGLDGSWAASVWAFLEPYRQSAFLPPDGNQAARKTQCYTAPPPKKNAAFSKML